MLNQHFQGRPCQQKHYRNKMFFFTWSLVISGLGPPCWNYNCRRRASDIDSASFGTGDLEIVGLAVGITSIT